MLLVLKARRRAAVAGYNDQVFLAWQTAFLPHQKRPPKLESLMRKAEPAGPKPPASPDQLFATMTRWRFATAKMRPAANAVRGPS